MGKKLVKFESKKNKAKMKFKIEKKKGKKAGQRGKIFDEPTRRHQSRSVADSRELRGVYTDEITGRCRDKITYCPVRCAFPLQTINCRKGKGTSIDSSLCSLCVIEHCVFTLPR